MYKGKLRTVKILGAVFLRIIHYRDRSRRRHTETTMEPDIEFHYQKLVFGLPSYRRVHCPRIRTASAAGLQSTVVADHRESRVAHFLPPAAVPRSAAQAACGR